MSKPINRMHNYNTKSTSAIVHE